MPRPLRSDGRDPNLEATADAYPVPRNPYSVGFAGHLRCPGRRIDQNRDMPTQPVQRFSLQCNDGEEAQSFLSRAYVPLHVKATHEPIDFETIAVHCGGLGISTSTSRSGIQMMFDEPFDGYGMSMPLSGVMSVDIGAGASATSLVNGGLMMDSRTVESAMFSSHSVWHRITLSTDELHGRLVALTEQPVHRRLQFTPHFQMDRGASRMLLTLGRIIIDGMQGDAPLLSAPTAIANLKETVLSMFIEGMPHSHTEHLNRQVALPAPRHVKLAIEFMHANLLSPLRLEDIAQASRISARSLQLAFRQFRGTTPMEHLRRLRLEGARSELRQGVPGTTVADVAYRWGFSHHGMFARRYAKLFGESPSATLRSRRRD